MGDDWSRLVVPNATGRPLRAVFHRARRDRGSLGARTIAAYHQVNRLRLGFDGERTVAEHLELLQLDGWRVVHDLRGEGFNVDPVIVGPHGVFTVETKPLRKPVADRNARVRFDGVSLTVDSHRFDRDPLAQARAQADWVSRRLEQLTMRRFPVRPVVVFPGWFVEHAKGMKSEVWVLEPKALRGWLKHEPQRLAAADVALVRDRLVSLAGDGDTPGPTG